MKLWLLTGTASGYDTYDSVVVAATTEEKAKQIFPMEGARGWEWYPEQVWARAPKDVKAVLIGTAIRGTPEGVVLASFNAG